VVLDTPEALKESVGKDRIQIQTADDARAIAEIEEKFGMEAAMHDNAVTLSVSGGEQFAPHLLQGLTVPIKSISISRPSLDDVFLAYTGRTIRDAEASAGERFRASPLAAARRMR